MGTLISTTCLLGLALVAGAQNAAPVKGAPEKKPARSAPRPTASVPPGKASSAGPQATDKATIVARSNVEVENATFTLGDIATIESGDKALAAQLAQMPIGASPLPGLFRLLTPGDITVRLRGGHFDEKKIAIVAPATMRIARASHVIAGAEIAQAAVAAAQFAIKDLPNTLLEPTLAPPSLAVTTGQARLLAGAVRGGVEQGTLTVPISVLVDGREVRVVDVPLRVHQKRMALLARRDVPPHDILAESDVMLVALELPPGFNDPITTVKAAVGKRATRLLRTGMPIALSALETPPVLSVNDRVTIEYLYGPIRITAPGLARQTGVLGDTVRIYALDTRKELEAVIVDSHTVRLTMDDAGE